MFYGKLTRTTIPKILSVSPVTTKEHPYKVKNISARQKNSKIDFFINYEKTATPGSLDWQSKYFIWFSF